MHPDRSSFTIEHPFLCVAILTAILGVLPFAVYFPPLVYVFAILSDKTVGYLLFEISPLAWLLISIFVLGRSYAHRKNVGTDTQ